MTTKQLRAKTMFLMFALLLIEFPELLLDEEERKEKPPFHVALNGNDGHDEDD